MQLLEQVDHQNDIKVVQEEDDSSAKDPFLFTFEFQDDMAMFLDNCVYEQGLKAACTFLKTILGSSSRLSVLCCSGCKLSVRLLSFS